MAREVPVDVLRDRLEALIDGQVTGCPIARFRAEMDPETAAQFDRVLASSVSTMRLQKELALAGLRTSRSTLQNHRSGECRCER